MLDTVEATIKNLPSISFEEFYVQYIDHIEDRIIGKEAQRMFSLVYDSKNVARIEKSLESMMKGVELLL